MKHSPMCLLNRVYLYSLWLIIRDMYLNIYIWLIKNVGVFNSLAHQRSQMRQPLRRFYSRTMAVCCTTCSRPSIDPRCSVPSVRSSAIRSSPICVSPCLCLFAPQDQCMSSMFLEKSIRCKSGLDWQSMCMTP